MRIRDLLSQREVELSFKPINKEAAISRLVDLLFASGCLSDPEQFKAAVFDREAEGSTGLGEGIAIPHAKSEACSKPGLAAMVVTEGMDFEAVDGSPVKLIFMIASPRQAPNSHLDVLARLSTLLMDENFRNQLISCTDSLEFLNLLDEKEGRELKVEQEQHEKKPQDEDIPYEIVALTACPAGLSHTYMAAEALEQKAEQMGISIKVEAAGAAGTRNPLLPEEIAKAKAVIVASDRAVPLDRFMGKRMVRTGVVDGVRKPQELIERALAADCPVYTATSPLTEKTNIFKKLYRHLMSGLIYILPLAATAGILSAIARLDMVSGTRLGLFLDTIGSSIGHLMFPVLSAFIAFSMARRTALVAGFTGGVIADMAGAGVVGAVVNGFIGGAAAFLMAQGASRFLKGHDALVALLVYPLLGATITTVIAQFITNTPCAIIDQQVQKFIMEAGVFELILVGAVLAGMIATDMGGPCNKTAYAFGVLLLADCLPETGAGSRAMAAVMLGGMVPPLAAALASGLIGRKRFTADERRLALSTFFKGLLFITEGVLPYLKVYEKRMRAACIAGAAVAGGIAMPLHTGICAPHGGIFIIPLSEKPWLVIFSLVAGTLVGALLFVFLRPAALQEHKDQEGRNA